jgi:hypothetical protein
MALFIVSSQSMTDQQKSLLGRTLPEIDLTGNAVVFSPARKCWQNSKVVSKLFMERTFSP